MFDDKTMPAMVDVTGTIANKAANKTGSKGLDDDAKRFMTILFSSRDVGWGMSERKGEDLSCATSKKADGTAIETAYRPHKDRQ
jgi:hypothetical protein